MSAQDPLYPVEAEQRVIGCCLRGPEEPQEVGKEIPASEISVRAARELSVGDFYDGGPYRMAFEVITGLIEGEPVRYSVDFQQQFHQAWRKRFPGTIVPVDVLEASNKVPTAYALPDYVAIVKAFSERRACIDRTAGALTLMRDPSQPLESGLAELARFWTGKRSAGTPTTDARPLKSSRITWRSGLRPKGIPVELSAALPNWTDCWTAFSVKNRR